MSLYSGKYNDEKGVVYGEGGKVGDTFRCRVNRKTGSVRFFHNKKDLGKAFQDDAIKEGVLYFAVQC